MYEQKYLKYKAKYLNLKNELSGGVGLVDVPEGLLPKMVSDNSTTCLQTMNTAKTSKPFANAIDFPNLTNNITTNIPNIYNRTSGVCRQIDNVARRNECNAYNNRCYIKELFDKYCNVRYQGQVLGAPVLPATYDVNTLNQILLRTIPNNIQDLNKNEDVDSLIKFGADIVHIDNNAFRYNQLTSITIPDSVITIGNFAFAHNQLVQITIPDSVITIGDGAFSNNRLAQVIIPNTVETIGAYTFFENLLTELTIPDSVTTIGDNAFNRNKLIEVTLPRRFKQEQQLLRIFGPDYKKIVFTYT